MTTTPGQLELFSSIREYLESKRFIDETTGCWFLTNEPDNSAYQQLTFRSKKYIAHRIAYRIYNKTDVDFFNNIRVCHKCDRKACWNPDHLFVGTDATNLEDSRIKNRRPYAKSDLQNRTPPIVPVDKPIVLSDKEKQSYNNWSMITWIERQRISR